MPILYDIRIQQSTKYVHKFKYTSRTGGDKGTTHILQYLAEPALLSAYLLSLVIVPAKEDAGDVILQMQLPEAISDGYVNCGENLAYQEVLKPVEG